MPGFQAPAPIFDFLGRINSELDGIAERSNAAVEALASVRTASEEAAESNRGSMQEIASGTAGIVTDVTRDLGAVRAEVTATEQAVAAGGAAITRSVSEAGEATERLRSAVDGVVTEQATALDDLIEKLLATETSYQETLLTLIEAGKAGLVSLDEIIKAFGNQEVVIDGQVQKLVTVFRRINWNEWGQQIRDFAEQVRDGATTLTEVEQFLADKQNVVARRLLEIIQMFRQGKVSLEAVLAVARDIERVFPGTPLDDLANKIAEGLRDGTLS